MGILQSIFCCCWDTAKQSPTDLITTLVTDADNPAITDISPKPDAEDNGEARYAPPNPASTVSSSVLTPATTIVLAPVTAESLTSVLHNTPPRHTRPGSSHSSPASVSSAASSRNTTPKFCND